MSARVDMYTVVVGIIDVRVYRNFINTNVIAVVYPIRPTGRLISHSDALDKNVLTSRQKNYARRCRCVYSSVFPLENRLYRLCKRLTVTIYRSASGDRYIFTLLSEDNDAFLHLGKKYVLT